MLSYVHAFHAGNHADILKHLTLSLILHHLCKKDKAFTVIDSHSGSGLYSLRDERAIKTGEAEGGVEKLLKSAGMLIEESKKSPCPDLSEAINSYLSLLNDFHSQNKYPGSPLIENAFLRNGDQQILNELHPRAYQELTSCFDEKEYAGTFKIKPQIHKRDAYELLRAFTPPKIKRGLAVIDPSFEDASDFEKCGKVIGEIHKKWQTGIIALWYPLISHRKAEITLMKENIQALVERLSSNDEAKILDLQLEIKKEEEMTGLASLYGSGMFIVNFPYQLDLELKSLMPSLSKILSESEENWSLDLY